MLYKFKSSKRKHFDASSDRLAKRIADKAMQYQRRWAEGMSRLTGKLPGKWVKALFTITALSVAAYSAYLLASGLYGLNPPALKQSLHKIKTWATDGFGFKQKEFYVLPDSLSSPAVPDSTGIDN